jgi:hypothetical protein
VVIDCEMTTFPLLKYSSKRLKTYEKWRHFEIYSPCQIFTRVPLSLSNTTDKEWLPDQLELLRRLRDAPNGGKKLHALWLSGVSKYASGPAQCLLQL